MSRPAAGDTAALSPVVSAGEIEPQLPAPAAPGAYELATLFLAALLLRLLICLISTMAMHLSLDGIAHLYDGNSYLATARAIAGQVAFHEYHARVFLGLPMTLAALSKVGIPMGMAALLLNWFSAATGAVLAARLFSDMRVGYACAILFPHTLMNSTLAMSESPMLALSLAAMVLMRSGSNHNELLRAGFAGVLLGGAMLFRPMACFAAGALIIGEMARSNWRRLIGMMITAGGVCMAGLLLQAHWRGDMLANFRYQAGSPAAYGGSLFDIPFRSLLVTPFTRHVGAGRIVYMWAHAAVVFWACIEALRVAYRSHRDADRSSKDSTPQSMLESRWLVLVAALWLLGNTAFLVSLGSAWGFECFHRFSIPAAPAMWWFLRGRLPRGKGTWLLLALASTAIAVLTMISDHRTV